VDISITPTESVKLNPKSSICSLLLSEVIQIFSQTFPIQREDRQNIACLDCMERPFLLGFDSSRKCSLQQYEREATDITDIIERLNRSIQLIDSEQRFLKFLISHSLKEHFILPS